MKKRLPKKYVYGDYDTKKKRAENYFKKGNIIEGYALLFAVVEQRLKQAWLNFVRKQNNLKFTEEYELKFSWEFAQIIRVFYEFGIISKVQYDIFQSFKKGRDKAVHELPFPLQSDKTSMPSLRQSFNDGLKADRFALEIQKKFPLIREEEMKNIGSLDDALIWSKKQHIKNEEMARRRGKL